MLAPSDKELSGGSSSPTGGRGGTAGSSTHAGNTSGGTSSQQNGGRGGGGASGSGNASGGTRSNHAGGAGDAGFAGSEGGEAGFAGEAGATGSGAGGEGGAGNSGVQCPTSSCDANASCSIVGGTPKCTCRTGFTGDGKSCRRFISCDEMHAAEPGLPSGSYAIRPAASDSEFNVYCEMSAKGGGWTLVLNDGPGFDMTTFGAKDVVCYEANCTNFAYGTVLVRADIMLDSKDGDIAGVDYYSRITVTGVHPATRGKSLRELFTTGPYYLELEDNSNLGLEIKDSLACGEALPKDFATLVCDSCPVTEHCRTSVITFGDGDSGCDETQSTIYAIGGSDSYTVPWTNCAGWPQGADFGDFQYYPENFRIWVR